jgi:hypothetical protein
VLFLEPRVDGRIVYTVNRLRTEIWILDGIQTPRAWWRRIFSVR